MLTEESDSVLASLVSSVNEIEKGADYEQPPLENVEIEHTVEHYVPAVVGETSVPSTRTWVRPTLILVGVMMLLGVIAFAGVMLWDPSSSSILAKQVDDEITTTIEIEVWDDVDCANDPTNQVCVESMKQAFPENSAQEVQQHFSA